MDLLRQVDSQILKDMGESAAGDALRIRNAIAKLSSVVGLDAKSTTPANPTETPAASAERRQVTVLFCDLVGSVPIYDDEFLLALA
jgi:class 3 adenylate cyclase